MEILKWLLDQMLYPSRSTGWDFAWWLRNKEGPTVHVSLYNNAFLYKLKRPFIPHREVDFFRVRNPFGGFFSIKLILPGPGFEPVTSRVAGRRCPCILSHLTQVWPTFHLGNIKNSFIVLPSCIWQFNCCWKWNFSSCFCKIITGSA